MFSYNNEDLTIIMKIDIFNKYPIIKEFFNINSENFDIFDN